MKPLPTTLRKGGFELTLVGRKRKAAIYRQHWPFGNPDNDAYEVILPRVLNTNFLGEAVPPYKAYPKAEEWGIRGWTLTTLDGAKRKLEEASQKAPRSLHVSRRNRSVAVPGSREGVTIK
jgi:hypothetical protein